MTSPVFTFIVGAGHKSFRVHTAIIAHYSLPLSVLVSGPMIEAREGLATLDDVDEGTFARFCQYAYAGDYDTPKAEVDAVSLAPSFPRTLSVFMYWRLVSSATC